MALTHVERRVISDPVAKILRTDKAIDDYEMHCACPFWVVGRSHWDTIMFQVGIADTTCTPARLNLANVMTK